LELAWQQRMTMRLKEEIDQKKYHPDKLLEDLQVVYFQHI
jgi:hypothetical protein